MASKKGSTLDSARVIIISAFALWTLFIMSLASADRFLPERWRFAIAPLEFDKTGQFGDSFGVISAIMASMAAYFAYKTYRASQDELQSLRRRTGEPTFLDLLERRFDLVRNVRHGNLSDATAIDSMAEGIRQNVKSGQPQETAFNAYAKSQSTRGLRNFFRYTYHIIRFAEDLFGFNPAAQGTEKRNNGSYRYVRLLRAQLSDSELLLIALNAIHDPDGENFKILLNRYGLLDNMNPSDIQDFAFRSVFTGDEFGLPP